MNAVVLIMSTTNINCTHRVRLKTTTTTTKRRIDNTLIPLSSPSSATTTRKLVDTYVSYQLPSAPRRSVHTSLAFISIDTNRRYRTHCTLPTPQTAPHPHLNDAAPTPQQYIN